MVTSRPWFSPAQSLPRKGIEVEFVLLGEQKVRHGAYIGVGFLEARADHAYETSIVGLWRYAALES